MFPSATAMFGYARDWGTSFANGVVFESVSLHTNDEYLYGMSESSCCYCTRFSQSFLLVFSVRLFE